jgi:hypothetical protein
MLVGKAIGVGGLAMPKFNSLLSSLFLAILTATLITLAAAPAQAGDTNGYSYARIVRLSYVSGDVQIVRTDKSNNWEPAVLNMPIQQGFALGTNNGRAEIELESGCTIWLAENSLLQFTDLALSNGGRVTRMSLSEGTATFETSLSNGDTFEVSTPSVRITPANKAKFRIDMFTEGGAVSVFNGKVAANSAAGDTEVPKGDTFALNKKATKTALKRNPATDEWDHWVSTRETAETVALNQTPSYANAPFSYGMADLSAFGAWNYFPGYGYGWQPFGMTAGWAPFSAGQWMFYPSMGWTWLSAEPWGWVPYHFGGWQYSSSFGWMWMPGAYGDFTAAPVNWVGVGNHIGWTPRSVITAAPASTPMPVIVSTKAIGKEGKNHVMSASELAGKLTPNIEPASNGKSVASGTFAPSSAHFVVPTSASLSALRARLGANAIVSTAAKVGGGPAHLSAPSNEFSLTNAGLTASHLPSRPAPRAAFTAGPGGDGIPGYAPPMGRGTTASAPTTAAPAQSSSSHASTASSGHPR